VNSRHVGPPDPAVPAVSSKTTAPAVPGRLPSNECSLPRAHASLSLRLAWDLEEPATGVAARVLVAFATATRLPARFHPLSHHALYSLDGKWLDPWPFWGWTERRSSTSATKAAREHTLGIARSSFSSEHALALAGLATARPCGRLRARPKPRPTETTTWRTNGAVASARQARGESVPSSRVDSSSRGFTGQGLACLAASSLSRPSTCSFLRASPLRAAGRRRYPNPIHSDTSRHETAATPAGDSDTARRHWRKTPKPPWACVMGVTPRIQPAGERRLSRSHHASSTPAKGEDLRARSTHALTGEPSDGPPESAPRLRMGTPARRIRSQGPHHLPHREEEQDPLHPRCLPSVRPAGPEETPRPLAFAGHRRREQAPFGVPIRPAGGRDEPCLYPGRSSPQPVNKLWKTLDAFFSPTVLATFDEVTSRGPGCASRICKHP